MSTIAIVTGANRGIGFEIARQLAARGVDVVLTARRPDAGAAAVARLKEHAPRVAFHPLDVGSDDSAAALAAFMAGRFGRCDVLVNNAGIIAEGDDSILTVKPASVELTLATNTVGPLRVTQALLPVLKRSERGGRVINMSSGAGNSAISTAAGRPRTVSRRRL